MEVLMNLLSKKVSKRRIVLTRIFLIGAISPMVEIFIAIGDAAQPHDLPKSELGFSHIHGL
jgi:hypothetical protein